MIVRKWAIHKSILDLPNERSSHTLPTPRGGGIAVVIVWLIGLSYYFFTKNIDAGLFFALLSGFPLAITGLFDDLVGLRPGIRFLIQVICAGIALYLLGGLQSFQFFTLNISFPLLLSLSALIAIVWSINLFNFLDGIDGYISSEVAFIGLSVFLLTGDQIGLLLTFTSIGFLIWNWQKAKIFMGDVGSTLLGFTIAVLAISHSNNNISSIPVWLILSSVFWFDGTITLFRRIKNKEHLSKAHKKHAYQRIVQAGFSHQKTVLWALGLNLVGFVFAFLATQYKTYDWLFLIADLVILIIVLTYIDRKKPFLYT
ncbi:MAG: glycosyltransferase family 4 protein [Bacteroidia bacterium]|nr:glycosyltransferase family 4 protein [Bacteroidia bacterium]